MANMALDMYDSLNSFNSEYGESLNLRIGLHTGAVVAGVMGKRNLRMILWGDAVNTASRMESNGIPGIVHLSESTYKLIQKDGFAIESRGEIEVKGKGKNEYLHSKNIRKSSL